MPLLNPTKFSPPFLNFILKASIPVSLKSIQQLALYCATALFLFLGSCGTFKGSADQTQGKGKEIFAVSQIKTDTWFESHQSISLLTIPFNALKAYKIEIGYSDPELLKTSTIAKSYNAIAAINGGFFDMDKGGSVHYLEQNDQVISKTRPVDSKWAKSDKLANGAIVISKKAGIDILPSQSDHYYEDSKDEAVVMVSGPLLIQDSKSSELPDLAFTHNRHPRTCLCITDKAVLFIAIDGRSATAQGMSLTEAQQYLLSLGCVDAINLDGGGSTTLWTKDRDIVNHPSDATGERKVANALLLIER